MSEITLWREQEMDKLRRDMDLLFNRFRRSFGVPRSLLEPTEAFGVSVSEGESTVTVKVDLPEISPADIEISVTDDTLTLKGKTKADKIEEGDAYRRVEKSIRSFSRNIALPCRITPEEVKASFKDGNLEIVLPKCKTKEIRGISIEVK